MLMPQTKHRNTHAGIYPDVVRIYGPIRGNMSPKGDLMRNNTRPLLVVVAMRSRSGGQEREITFFINFSILLIFSTSSDFRIFTVIGQVQWFYIWPTAIYVALLLAPLLKVRRVIYGRSPYMDASINLNNLLMKMILKWKEKMKSEMQMWK